MNSEEELMSKIMTQLPRSSLPIRTNLKGELELTDAFRMPTQLKCWTLDSKGRLVAKFGDELVFQPYIGLSMLTHASFHGSGSGSNTGLSEFTQMTQSQIRFIFSSF